MDYQYSIFFVISIIASIVSCFVGVYGLYNFRQKGGRNFSYLMFSVALWTFSIGMGMISPTESINFIWAIFRMIGVFLTPIMWFIFALQYTDKDRSVSGNFFWVLYILPSISLVMMITNNIHHLFIEDILYFRSGIFLIDEVWVLGPWFWVHYFYSTGLTIAADIFIIQFAIQQSRKFKRHAVILIAGALIPTVVNLMFLLHLIPGLKVNYDPLGLVITGILFTWGLFQHKLIDVKPIARQLLVDNMRDGMIVLDAQNHIVDLNPAACLLMGFQLDECIGEPVESIEVFQKLNIFQNSRMDDQEITNPEDGKVLDMQVSNILMQNRNLGRLLVIRDISLRKQLENELQEMAITDSLTGLYNRRYFHILFEREMERAKRFEHQFSLMMFDIDDFKKVNDSFGHVTGDHVLCKIGEICSKNLRSPDVLARYGGEEFMVLLPETKSSQAFAIAERLRRTIADHDFLELENSQNITISLGIVTWKDGSEIDMGDLIQQVDRALYVSKQNGKNQTTIFSV